ncbi:hypothetical protein QO227_21205 [Vibrio vulnificus]|nr:MULTISPECIES: hypothetical protein [Vibrio]MCU8102790.1 hypothetical protein [Vibrio vulnificus]MCU8154948.1 hypothetical protein [Vibrio vulnificus]MCU8356974.1 hypothetical protein [Vibrio vulnificus]MCU8474310.1 hypothetical protein [Vibrio vulnificus]MCU8496989.1 hypothetical protein [Vibrio vulnificus]
MKVVCGNLVYAALTP